jgi:FtsP/CotA-like multicopper oxidase with cupredoxin domain
MTSSCAGWLGCVECLYDQEDSEPAPPPVRHLLAQPADPDYWSPVDRELVLTVDDLLVEDGQTAPFNPTETSYAAMGRFGNVCLVSGGPDPVLEVRAGEVVRLWLTNTASTRVFNLRVPGARMKLVGRGSGLGTAGSTTAGVTQQPSSS